MDKIIRLPEYLKTKIATVDNQNYKKVRFVDLTKGVASNGK